LGGACQKEKRAVGGRGPPNEKKTTERGENSPKKGSTYILVLFEERGWGGAKDMIGGGGKKM